MRHRFPRQSLPPRWMQRYRRVQLTKSVSMLWKVQQHIRQLQLLMPKRSQQQGP
ncbi:unnamed protein product [Musa acuminata subsp. burmannicoides]